MPAFALRLVKRFVGAFEKRVVIAFALRGLRDAHADRHLQIFERLGERLENTLYRYVLRFVPLEEHEEFVAADARDDVLFSQNVAQLFRYVFENVVAEAVPVRIVDRLEIIEVDDQHDVFPFSVVLQTLDDLFFRRAAVIQQR